ALTLTFIHRHAADEVDRARQLVILRFFFFLLRRGRVLVAVGIWRFGFRDNLLHFRRRRGFLRRAVGVFQRAAQIAFMNFIGRRNRFDLRLFDDDVRVDALGLNG